MFDESQLDDASLSGLVDLEHIGGSFLISVFVVGNTNAIAATAKRIMETTRRIRQSSLVPIILLTALGE